MLLRVVFLVVINVAMTTAMMVMMMGTRIMVRRCFGPDRVARLPSPFQLDSKLQKSLFSWSEHGDRSRRAMAHVMSIENKKVRWALLTPCMLP